MVCSLPVFPAGTTTLFENFIQPKVPVFSSLLAQPSPGEPSKLRIIRPPLAAWAFIQKETLMTSPVLSFTGEHAIPPRPLVRQSIRHECRPPCASSDTSTV